MSTDIDAEPAAMTGAELRSYREYLGLSPHWMSRHLDVNERDLERMERGQEPIYDGVAGDMDDLLCEASNLVDQLVDRYKPEVEANGGQARIPTFRTDSEFEIVSGKRTPRYPARWHRQICARVAERVPGLDLVYADVDD